MVAAAEDVVVVVVGGDDGARALLASGSTDDDDEALDDHQAATPNVRRRTVSIAAGWLARVNFQALLSRFTITCSNRELSPMTDMSSSIFQVTFRSGSLAANSNKMLRAILLISHSECFISPLETRDIANRSSIRSPILLAAV